MDINNGYILVQIIKGFLGSPQIESNPETTEQWQFNCPSPKCRHDVDKFNLEFNSNKKVFKCWKCGYVGFIKKLAKDYGTQKDIDRIDLLIPKDSFKKRKLEKSKPKLNHHLVTCKLPEGYIPIGRASGSNLYNMAINYLNGSKPKQRNVNWDLIDKYQIGYTETGNRKFRIIIPSKNELGNFNYYEARSYMKNPKIPYQKPKGDEVHKNDIIFNESNINWDLPVYLCEGVFDMFRLPNAIPVLGKEVSPLLTSLLIKHKSRVIICFDPDAISKTLETYNMLSSQGLDVSYVDLTGVDKDIAKIYEDHGIKGVRKALMNIKKPTLSTEIKKFLK